MKVAVVSTGLGHIYRGVEAWANDTAAALYERKIDVTLFKGGGKPENTYEKVVSCFRRNLPINRTMVKIFSRLSGWRYFMGDPYQVEQITFALNSWRYFINDYDIIHTQDPQFALFFQKLKNAKLIKPEVIFANGTAESAVPFRKLKYLQELSPYLLEHGQKAGISKPTWFWAPNFIDPEIFKPRDKNEMRKKFNIPQDAFVIIQIAAIKKHHKRIDFALDVIKQLKDTLKAPIYYIIAGGVEQDTKEVCEYGASILGESFRYFIDFDRAEIPYLYNAADIFMLTSQIEIFGIVFLEAMASGIPVVGSHYPVQQWIIDEAGDAVNMDDKDTVVSVLKKYITDKDYYINKQKNARPHVIRTFSKDVVIQEYIKKYEDVLNNAVSH